jgi:hypothetical protein
LRIDVERANFHTSRLTFSDKAIKLTVRVCLGCGSTEIFAGVTVRNLKWSPHLDWYNGLENIVEKLKEEIDKDWKREKMPA